MRRNGFTLVELMVTLTILTGLATVAAVSTAGLRERACVNETIRQGEALRDAIERTDGVSFVSDMGFVPTNMAQLVALQQNSYYSDMTLNADGSVDVKASSLVQLPSCGVVSTNLVSGAVITLLSGLSFTATDVKTATNGFPQVELNAGWRGPYVTGQLPFKGDDEPCLADPWGGAWRVAAQSTEGSVTLTSLGRDREENDETDVVDWADRDRSYETRQLQGVTLRVTVKPPDNDIAETPTTAVCIYTPELEPSSSRVSSRGRMIVRAICKSAENNYVDFNGFTLSNGLTPGYRVVWAVMRVGSTIYSAPPRTVRIGSGNTEVTIPVWQRAVKEI